MGGLQIPAARISDTWISKDIVKDDGLGGDPKSFPLDWQEPDNVALPASNDVKNPSIEIIQTDLTTIRVPAVIFTATFDPPLVLPQSDWMSLYQYANLDPPPLSLRLPTFDQLFFPVPPGVHQDPSEHRTIKKERCISVFGKDGKPVTKTHHNSLFIYKQIYSMQLSNISFSHPKQLINMLPLLRQWAFTSTLLENSFCDKGQDQRSTNAGKPMEPLNKVETNGPGDKDRLNAFMHSSTKLQRNLSNQTASGCALNLDIILWVHPTPHFQVVFPFRDSKANITVQILHNGVVEVVDENILSQNREGSDASKKITREILGKTLEYMEDLCKWAEWIRSRLS